LVAAVVRVLHLVVTLAALVAMEISLLVAQGELQLE
jgi:hypothetical protein